MTLNLAFKIIACLCFLLAAFGVAAFGVLLLPLGLAFFVASFMP